MIEENWENTGAHLDPTQEARAKPRQSAVRSRTALGSTDPTSGEWKIDACWGRAPGSCRGQNGLLWNTVETLVQKKRVGANNFTDGRASKQTTADVPGATYCHLQLKQRVGEMHSNSTACTLTQTFYQQWPHPSLRQERTPRDIKWFIWAPPVRAVKCCKMLSQVNNRSLSRRGSQLYQEAPQTQQLYCQRTEGVQGMTTFLLPINKHI